MLPLLLDAAAGLAHLHAELFVHRDVKPSNILVAAGRAFVADLGLAREKPETAAVLTLSPGTPGYIAPEARVGRYGVSADVRLRRGSGSLGASTDCLGCERAFEGTRLCLGAKARGPRREK